MRTYCPLSESPTFSGEALAAVGPLLAHLQTNVPVADVITFPRGTIMADGRLDLCKQSLGLAGCRRVTEALAGNTVIRSVLLGTNGIGDAGAVDVARLITRNPNITTVYLGCNLIGEAGAVALAEALTNNTTVTKTQSNRPRRCTSARRDAAPQPDTADFGPGQHTDRR